MGDFELRDITDEFDYTGSAKFCGVYFVKFNGDPSLAMRKYEQGSKDLGFDNSEKIPILIIDLNGMASFIVESARNYRGTVKEAHVARKISRMDEGTPALQIVSNDVARGVMKFIAKRIGLSNRNNYTYLESIEDARKIAQMLLDGEIDADQISPAFGA